MASSWRRRAFILRSAPPSLFAYASGLRITSSFIIGGTSTVLLLAVGFLLLKEPFTWTKLLAIGLIALGIFLLQRTDI